MANRADERALRRLMKVLERRVFNERNLDLRNYFSNVVWQMQSLTAGGAENGMTMSTEEDLEQMALLFMHYDVDSDGVLNRDEFRELMRLVASKSGQQSYTDDHIDKLFRQYDIDANEQIDLNELLLLHVGRRLEV
jgi:hypothetical protein